MPDAASPSLRTGPGVSISTDERRRRRELVAIGVLGCVLALLGGIAFSLLTASLGSSSRPDPARARATAASSEGRPTSPTVPGSVNAATVEPGAVAAGADAASAGSVETDAADSATPSTTTPASAVLVNAGGSASPTTIATPPPTTRPTTIAPPTTEVPADSGSEPAP